LLAHVRPRKVPSHQSIRLIGEFVYGTDQYFESLEHRLLFATAVDLRVTNVIVPPGLIAYSGTFGTSTDLSLEIELHNAGTTTYNDRPNTTVAYSRDPSFDIDDPFATASLGMVTLAPGETKRIRADELIADDEMDAGNYFIRVRVLPYRLTPPLNITGELNMADNFFAVTGGPSVQIVTSSVPGAFISGTLGRDLIELRSGHPGGFALFATVNGLTRRVPSEWERVFVGAGDGNDVIRVAPTDQGHRLNVDGIARPFRSQAPRATTRSPAARATRSCRAASASTASTAAAATTSSLAAATTITSTARPATT